MLQEIHHHIKLAEPEQNDLRQKFKKKHIYKDGFGSKAGCGIQKWLHQVDNIAFKGVKWKDVIYAGTLQEHKTHLLAIDRNPVCSIICQ